jgi:hypothetical protein
MDRYFENERGSRTIKQTLVKTRSRIGQVCNSTRKNKIMQSRQKSITFNIIFLLTIGDGSLGKKLQRNGLKKIAKKQILSQHFHGGFGPLKVEFQIFKEKQNFSGNYCKKIISKCAMTT